jgi:hypothetical protein
MIEAFMLRIVECCGEDCSKGCYEEMVKRGLEVEAGRKLLLVVWLCDEMLFYPAKIGPVLILHQPPSALPL